MNKKPLTKKQYVKKCGVICPFCQSDQIEGFSIEVDGPIAWQPIICNDCNSEWDDIYELTGYEKK